ncbi:MAG: NADH-quinone oxidoreductase subunit NuoG [Truepera sp.]|nr:NADH-quinone oxidoreductase subunit NuoG [Truepera sp.]
MRVRVDGVELELAPGTSAIDAVFAAGFDLPYFCSQEYMSPIGACRLCLARLGAPRRDRVSGDWILDEETGEPKIFYFPNLMATCTTAVMEGMVIDTRSEEVRAAQRSMMEFTLINHPLDCPVCDKGGACELQDRAYEYGSGLSRFVFDKRHQEKHHALSGLITLDRERCIHCKRCVRYFEEVPGDEVLDFIERGGHTYIGNVEAGLPSNFSGNITDICPVGALLDTTSRFRGRNWEYDQTRTTSLDDASGSAIVVDARTGRIERIRAGLHPELNKSWIDDGIRFGHEYTGAADRIDTPLLRKGGELTPVTWDEAVGFVASELRGLGGKDVGVAIRADATLEEGVAALALADQLKTGQVDHYPRAPASVIPAGPRATLDDVARADALLVVADVTEEVPAADLRIKDALKGVAPPELLPHGVPIADLRLQERMVRERDRLAVAAPYRTDLMRHAGLAAIYRAGREAALFGALTALASGGELPADGLEGLGLARAAAESLARRLTAAERPVIICGGLVLADRAAAAAAAGLAELVGARLLLLGPMANSFGLELIGVLPSHGRYSYPAMIEAKALILSGLDPAQAPRAARALAGTRLLVVHDLFLTETARRAQVVLPARSGYGKEGTIVNLEGRLLPVRPVPVESGQAEDFTGLVRRLGEALAVRLEGRSARSARRVLRKRFEFDLEELPDEGRLDWPAAPPARQVAADEPRLEGNAVLTRSMVRPEYLGRNPHLAAVTGGVLFKINPADAAGYGLREGDQIRIDVGGFRRRVVVRLSDALPGGLVQLPSLPDQPPGLAVADLAGLEVERTALELV